ncbi:MAG: hypothetical protein KDB35_18055 [Acidimicrobiales bacterium]|nr:hypothetical protein [Acidimicrobiales bacterium]
MTGFRPGPFAPIQISPPLRSSCMHMSRRLASVSATALLLALAPAAHAGCGLGDLDGNGTVDGADLGMLLASWGRGGAGDLDANGTIDGAVSMPMADLPRRIDELDPTRPTVVFCAGGYRSSVAASLLRSEGFADVSDLLGGFTAWVATPATV